MNSKFLKVAGPFALLVVLTVAPLSAMGQQTPAQEANHNDRPANANLNSNMNGNTNSNRRSRRHPATPRRVQRGRNRHPGTPRGPVKVNTNTNPG